MDTEYSVCYSAIYDVAQQPSQTRFPTDELCADLAGRSPMAVGMTPLNAMLASSQTTEQTRLWLASRQIEKQAVGCIYDISL